MLCRVNNMLHVQQLIASVGWSNNLGKLLDSSKHPRPTGYVKVKACKSTPTHMIAYTSGCSAVISAY